MPSAATTTSRRRQRQALIIVLTAAAVALVAGPAPASAQYQVVSGDPISDAPSHAKGVAPKAQAHATWPRVPIALAAFSTRPNGAKAPIQRRQLTIGGAIPTKQVPHPRPGQVVTFSAEGSSDIDGAVTAYTWRVEHVAGGVVTSELREGAIIEVPTGPHTTHVRATLQVVDADGLTSSTAVDVPVVANVPPVVSLDRFKKHLRGRMLAVKGSAAAQPQVSGTVFGGGAAAALQGIANFGRVNKPLRLYANAVDPDGRIQSYAFDATPLVEGFETQAGLTDEVVVTPLPTTGGEQTWQVRVTDDEGAQTTASISLPVIPDCADGSTVQVQKNLRLTPRTGCLAKLTGTRYSLAAPGGTFTLNGLEITAKTAEVRWDSQKDRGHVTSPSAVVTGQAPSGARLDLAAGPLAWTVLPNGRIINLKTSGAKLSGLDVTKVVGEPSLANGGFAARIVAAAPAIFGPSGAGPTGNEVSDFTIPGAQAAAAQSGGFTIGRFDMEIGGVAIEDALLHYSGDDDWDIAGTFRLKEPVKTPFALKGAAGIRDGDFAYLSAELNANLPTPLPGLTLTSLGFDMDLGAGIETACVPRVGVKRISMASTRAFLMQWVGFTEEMAYKSVPDFDADYGRPSFALCGSVGFRYGPKVLGASLAEGKLSIGIAKYPDREGVFRVLGKPLKVLGIPTKVSFEAYDDGYVEADVSAQFVLEDLLKFYGNLNFQARMPRFNAKLYAELCILKFGIGCASGTILASSKGIGACLGIDTFLGEWTPGATYVFGGSLTPYFQGCDVDDVRVAVKGSNNVIYTPLPPPGSGTASVAQQSKARVEPGQQIPLPVKAGMPGAVLSVRGQGGLPRFRIVAPGGRVGLTVDDVPDPRRITKPSDNPMIFKDPATGITSVILRRPGAGTWTIQAAGDSRPIVEVVLAEGVPHPKVTGRTRAVGGGRRQLRLQVADRRKGLTATVVEHGASGGQILGTGKLQRGVTKLKPITFTPAARISERRRVRVVIERNGFPVAIEDVPAATFTASRPAPPPKVRDVRIRRTARSVDLRWDPVARAQGYEVEIRTSDGRRLTYTTRTNRLKETMPTRATTRIEVRVRAISGLGRRGSVGRAVRR